MKKLISGGVNGRGAFINFLWLKDKVRDKEDVGASSRVDKRMTNLNLIRRDQAKLKFSLRMTFKLELVVEILEKVGMVINNNYYSESDP